MTLCFQAVFCLLNIDYFKVLDFIIFFTIIKKIFKILLIIGICSCKLWKRTKFNLTLKNCNEFVNKESHCLFYKIWLIQYQRNTSQNVHIKIEKNYTKPWLTHHRLTDLLRQAQQQQLHPLTTAPSPEGTPPACVRGRTPPACLRG